MHADVCLIKLNNIWFKDYYHIMTLMIQIWYFTLWYHYTIYFIIMIIIKQRTYFWLDLTHIDISKIISYYVSYDLIICMKYFWSICYTTFYCMLNRSTHSFYVLYCTWEQFTIWYYYMNVDQIWSDVIFSGLYFA